VFPDGSRPLLSKNSPHMKCPRLPYVRLAISFCFLLAIAGCAAGQNDPAEVTAKEVSLLFQHPAKQGITRVHSIERARIPNGPKVPNSYKPLNENGYLVSTEVIDLGRTTAFFKVPANTQDEFSRVRILRLVANELAPGGYEWKDCTTSVEAARSQQDPQVLEQNKDFDEWYTARMGRLLPDFASRTITCRPDDKWKNKEYFVLASKITPPPSRPFTTLTVTIAGKSRLDGKKVVYRVSIKNAGQKDIAHVSVSSRFDVDLSVDKVVPTQGTCVPSALEVSGRTAICHLGRLAAGSELTLEFVGSETGMSRTVENGKLNAGWSIEAYFVETLGDPFWGANRLSFRPVADSSN